MEISPVDRNEAFRYMGFVGRTPNESFLERTDRCEKLLIKAAVPRYTYSVFRIVRTGKTMFLDGTDFVLDGNDIASHLEGCKSCVLMCCTLSDAVDRLIRVAQIDGMTDALILDALASAAIEQICEKAEIEIRAKYPDKHFTWRFSPGYGDFPIEAQGKFLDVLFASKRIGVCVNDGGMLTPAKSVTAIIGISDAELEAKRSGCAECNLRENCSFRKNMTHC